MIEGLTGSELKAKHAARRARIAARRPNARRRAAAALVELRRRARNRLVVLVGPGSWAAPVVTKYPGRFKLDRHVLVMRAAGWSVTRIAREYGVQPPAVWKWLKRRRAGPVAARRPGWLWRCCGACSGWGWFRQTSTRKRGGRVFCSLACYRARGRKGRTKGRGATGSQGHEHTRPA